LTKAELRSVAMRELDVSKLSFDMGWIMAIEDADRRDGYSPLRRRLRTNKLACLLSTKVLCKSSIAAAISSRALCVLVGAEQCRLSGRAENTCSI
jgi:hypothetical protein